MSINIYNPQQRGENVVNLPQGEVVLQNRGHVTLSFKTPTHPNDFMKKSYDGRVMATNRRVIFVTKSNKALLRDFAMPFSSITNWELKQPIFGQNYISSTIKAAPNGGWEGKTTINLTFSHGGACEFGQLVLRTASTANSNTTNVVYPPPPPSYDNGYIPTAVPVAGQLDPMTGFYNFPGQQQPPQQYQAAPPAPPQQQQADAPPSYDSLQEQRVNFIKNFRIMKV